MNTITELQATLLNVARAIDPSADIIDVRVDGDGFGLVMWKRTLSIGDQTFPEYITHRWATKDTAGQPVKPFFHTGGYYDHEVLARADFRNRRIEVTH